MTIGEEALGTFETTIKATKNHNAPGSLEEDVRLNLDRYAEFLDANPSYVVSDSVLARRPTH